MPSLTLRPLTFEEFTHLPPNGRRELIAGRVEELMTPLPRHGWTQTSLIGELVAYLNRHDPDGYRGAEVEIPTLPGHGRRPDFVYYGPEVRSHVDLARNRVVGPPTLAVEILSEGEEDRDRVTKREEYAQAGIPHYWLLDPVQQTVLLLTLTDAQYCVAAEFRRGDTLTSDLFPGLEIPLSRLFV